MQSLPQGHSSEPVLTVGSENHFNHSYYKSIKNKKSQIHKLKGSFIREKELMDLESII